MKQNQKSWVLAYSVLIVMVVGFGLFVRHGPTGLDSAVLNAVEGTRATGMARAVSVLSDLYSPMLVPVWALAAAAYLLFRDRRVHRAVTVLAAVAGAGVVAEVVKVIVERPRPPAVDQIPAYEAAMSYPSGHVTGTAALVVSVALVGTIGASRAARVAAVSMGVVTTAFVAWTRLYLGVHWFSDVIAGCVVGAATAVVAVVLVPRIVTTVFERFSDRLSPGVATWLAPASGRHAWSDAGRRALVRVPLVTGYFWTIKIMATTVGETYADDLNGRLGWGLTATTLFMAVLLVAVLVVQFSRGGYTAWVYWPAVALISVVGTLITDNLTDNRGVPLQVTTAVFAIALVVVFAGWYLSERTLSIHTITTRRREAFYWLTILVTFALGTAAGDLLAEKLNLGYVVSLLIFAAVIAAIALAYWKLHLNAVVAFWAAYVLTRPLGASIGDLLSQPRDSGGFGLGTSLTSTIFLTVIVVLVAFLSVTKRDVIEPVEVGDRMVVPNRQRMGAGQG
ncbi:phosphatase PAP2 family protein [Gordonia hydrophobica]|uniref:Phosphatase PAP2 family protein n=1 Tax=Gordonia hydrophobica TaxID=40516 RepID=A0ABZ2U7G6_9ACTN|nr:phosphatase PAP2 family protein [Gordonia hydrophobica]MBM7368106.1 putative membrane-anchored protein [Gordonia hydrophobica]